MAIRANYPDILPTLNLDFANTKELDPRITFTRTTTATYYDGKTTAKAEENLLQQSQAFDNASWTGSNRTITANTVAAPDGTITAETIDDATAAGNHFLQQAVTTVSGQTYAFSVYAKNNTRTYVTLSVIYNASNARYASAVFNLSTGAVATSGASGDGFSVISTNITESPTGSGWYRCTLIFTTGTTFPANYVIIASNSTGAIPIGNYGLESYTGSNKTLYLWGAQLEQRSSVTAYTATTASPITNYIPVLQTAAAGQPRFDHNPTTGESLGLLIEEARTNLALRTAEFDNASWTKTRTTITADTVVSPVGTLTADRIVASTDNDTHFATQTFTGTAVAYTFSVFAKAGGYNHIAMRLFDGTSQVGLAYYNLSTGATGTVTAGTAAITSVGNGWYRCALTATLAASASCTADIYVGSADNTNSFVGNAFDAITIWGAQLEAGSFATSYIPTTSATVTRNADDASMTGTNFTNWYNTYESSFYLEYQSLIGTGTNTNGNVYFALRDISNANNYIWFYALNTTSDGTYHAAGTMTTAISARTLNKRKFACGIKENDFAGVIDGGSITTDTSFQLPEFNLLGIGKSTSTTAGKYIRKLSYYPKRLSNTELQSLSSV